MTVVFSVLKAELKPYVELVRTLRKQLSDVRKTLLRMCTVSQVDFGTLLKYQKKVSHL